MICQNCAKKIEDGKQCHGFAGEVLCESCGNRLNVPIKHLRTGAEIISKVQSVLMDQLDLLSASYIPDSNNRKYYKSQLDTDISFFRKIIADLPNTMKELK